MSSRVLAHHAHVFPEAIDPNGTIDRLLAVLDACQIDQAVCFAPFAHQWSSSAAGAAGAGKNSDDQNRWLATELKGRADRRLFGFGTLDLSRDDAKDQVIRARQQHGLLGLKLHPNAQRFDILSRQMFEVYEAAQDQDLFLTFHTGVHRSRLLESAVLRFDEIAWNFPKLKFSMEHVGGYHFFDHALAVIFNHVPPPWEAGVCNVFAGLSSVFTKDQNRFWYLSDERLVELAAQVGARQLIFGLDYPYNREEQTRTGLATIRRLFTPAEQELILGGNLRRELGIAG